MKDSEFDDLLNAARGDVPLPHSFKQSVWHRIESEAAVLPISPYFGRRWVAAFGVAASVIGGLWLGAISIPETKDSQTTYAESISPFAHVHGK